MDRSQIVEMLFFMGYTKPLKDFGDETCSRFDRQTRPRLYEFNKTFSFRD